MRPKIKIYWRRQHDGLNWHVCVPFGIGTIYSAGAWTSCIAYVRNLLGEIPPSQHHKTIH
jgi:hypothetical protein